MSKFNFPIHLFARTTNNKTIDVSYVYQDSTSVEYIKFDAVEKEIEKFKEVLERRCAVLHPDDLEYTISYGQIECLKLVIDAINEL